MKNSLDRITAFVLTEDATAATEYAIMLSLIVLAAIGSISSLGNKVAATFHRTATLLPS